MNEKKLINYEDFAKAKEAVLENAELIIRIVSNTRFTDTYFSDLYRVPDALKIINAQMPVFAQLDINKNWPDIVVEKKEE